MKKYSLLKYTAVLSLILSAGCTADSQEQDTVPEETANTNSPETNTVSPSAAPASSGTISADSVFTDRDLKQTADLSQAIALDVQDNQEITITKEGIYLLSGTASEYTVRVEASKETKVQLVLDGLDVTNTDFPVIYVVSADKVFITTTDSNNTLEVTGAFRDDGDTGTDAVIFSKDDLVLNGTGTLNIVSSDNGISSKDDLKITGGTLNITSAADALEAHDSVAIADGNITIHTPKDGIHSEDDEDDTVGYVYIGGGTLNIEAGDDAVHATTVLQIDGGTLDIQAHEALEATVVEINGGDIAIQASDDGINAGQKSTAYTPLIEINGGTLQITMSAGDTDALDSNGDLIINGGTVDITAQFAFDYVGQGILNGGTVLVNGTQVTTITESMMEGGMQGQMPQGGQMPEGAPGGQMPGENPNGQPPQGQRPGGHRPGGN